MSGPVDINAARNRRAGFAVCPACSGCYFKVDVVTLNPDGSAAGYSGNPICANCGAAMTGLWPESARSVDTEEQTDEH